MNVRTGKTREQSATVAIDRRAIETWEVVMNGLIYLVGLVVVILAVLSFFGLR